MPNYFNRIGDPAGLCCAFAALHHTDSYTRAVAGGGLVRSPDFTIFLESIRELEGLTMGIIGYGAIGSSWPHGAGLWHAGAAVSRRPKDASWVRFVDLSSCFRKRCAHPALPQTEQTSSLIIGRPLRKEKGGILINTARGGLLDEQAVADALNSGDLEAAALDVLSSEPPSPDNPLLRAKNCLITPHIAWAGLNARRRLLEVTFDNIRGYLAGRPVNVVNP